MYIAKIGYIVVSIILGIFGLSFIAKWQIAKEEFEIICAVVLILFGLVKLIAYCSKDLYRLAFQYDLEFGIILIIIGIFLLLHQNIAPTHSCVIVAITILMDALFKIRIIFEAKEFGIKCWSLILIIDLIVIILCNLLIFAKETLILKIFGYNLIATAVLNFAVALALVKIIKHQYLDEEKVLYRK